MNLQFYAQFQLASARNLAMMLLLSTYGWFAPAVMGQTQISTWEDLHHIRDNLNGEYILVNDLNENTDGYNTYASELVNDGEGWLPIGHNTDGPFTGIFDGGGHVIQHLFINRNANRIGLFGFVLNGEVKNVYLENINVTGDNYVGGLIGNNAGDVISSYTTGTVNGSDNVGGLIGENTGDASGSNATATVNGNGKVGGLIGNNTGNISTSFASGIVSGDEAVGGLVGGNVNGGDVRNSFSVSASTGNNFIAGLIGNNAGNLTASYATGTVNGDGSYIGGLIGRNSGDVTDSFWNTETTGQDGPGEGTGLTTNEMQQPKPFLDANWGFWNDDDSGTNGAWGWNPDENDGYPFLRYQGFVDVTFPVVENKVPENDETGVEVNTVITLEFNQDVNEVDLDEVQITNADTGPVSGLAVTLDGNKLALEDAELEEFTLYSISIPEGTVKSNYDIENQEVNWDFTTIRTAPVAVNESPSDGLDCIALDADITVEFDQEVNEADLDDIAITDMDGNTVKGMEATLNDNELIISHADLTNFTEYTVTIPGGALKNKDNVGNLAHSWSFTTAMTAPVAIKETPKDEATDIKLDTKMLVTLDQQVTAVDVSGGLITDDRGDTLAGIELMVEGQEIIITRSELDNATRYSVFIPAGVAMNEDEILNEPYTWSFTTVHATPPVVMLTYPQDEVLDIGQLPKFIWKEADHATEYHLQVASEADFNELLIDELELEAHTFMPENELNRQQVYYWRVRAINAGGAGGWPDAYRFETSPAPPPQVILGAPVDSAGAITLLPNLSWEAASGADNYRLELAADADFNKLILAVDEIGATEYSMDEELDYYGIYHWRVQAINSGGIGKWSQGGVFITEAKVPEPQFPADHADNMSIAPEISWSSPYEELNYDLRLSTKVDLNEGAEEYVTTGTKLQVSGLQTNTKYYWQVRLSDELTQSGWSESSSFTTRNNLRAETLPVSFDFTLQESGQIDPVDYQMIGLPGHHKAYMDEVLEGDYSEVWRAFSDTGGEDDFLLEYDSKSNRLAFGPGFGFWAFYRDSLNLDLNYIPVPLDEHDTFAIDIQPGWNIIANPFASMVAWSEVQAFNEIDGDLFSYNKLFEEAHTLMPYVGYYFYNKPRWGLKKLEIPYGNPDKRRSMINTGPDRIAYKAQESRDDSRQLRLKALFKTESGELAAYTDVTWNYKPDYSAAQYPSLEMSRYGMVFPDEIPDGITRSIGANYKETGTAYDLTVKAPVGRTMHWEADFQSLSDQARVLLVNPASHQSRLLANGDIIEMIVSEPEVSYQVHIGHEAYLQEIQENLLPDEITLRQNYPNPFNPSTNITYALIEDVEMRLDVYDILGRRVQTLVQGYQEQGWYTVPFDGLGLSSGVYIYRLVSGQHILTEKMMLIK